VAFSEQVNPIKKIDKKTTEVRPIEEWLLEVEQ